MANALVPLGTITTSSAVTSVNFDSINQTYKDLVLMAEFAIVSVITSSTIMVTLNGNSANNLSNTLNNSNNTISAVVGTGTDTGRRVLTAGGGTGQHRIRLEFHLFDYATTDKNKSSLIHAGQADRTGSSTNIIHQTTARNFSLNDAITSLSISTTGANNLAGGALFSLYGVRG